MRVFACYVVSKLQRHRCPIFGAIRFRTQRAFSHLTLSAVRAHLAFFCTYGALSHNHSLTFRSAILPVDRTRPRHLPACFLLYTWRPPAVGTATPYFAGA
jgi:hypothetical protein